MKIRRLVAIAAVALAALGVAGPAAAAGSYPPVPPAPGVSLAPGLQVASQVAKAVFQIEGNGHGSAVAGSVIEAVFNHVPCSTAYVTTTVNGGAGETITWAVANGQAKVGPLLPTMAGTYVLTLSCDPPVSAQRGNAVRAASASSYSATFTLTVTNAAKTSASGSGLPKTGGDGLTPLWVGLALLLTGGAFVGVTARRAKRSS